LHLYQAESLGLPEAIEVAISNGMQDVMFEIDSKVLSNTFDTTFTVANEFGDLVSHCRSFSYFLETILSVCEKENK